MINTIDGYKAYEFGIIPEDWEIKKIGEIFDDLKGGSTPSRKIEKYYTGDIPWITSGELKYRTIYSTLENITKEAVRDTNLKIYDEGTFFIAITGLEAEGTRGSCAITGVKATTNQSCMAFQPKNNFSNLYLYYWYCLYGDYIGLQYTQGTKQQSLNNKIVSDIEIPVPKFKEQEKIALILSSVDEKIEITDNLIEKTKELKKGLMQRLLKKGIGHDRFKDTEIGRIPEEWEVRKLKEVFKVSSGNFLPKKNVVEGNYPVYGGNGVTSYHNEYLFENSKIIIGRVGEKCGCICVSEPKSWITDNALFIADKIIEFEDRYMFYLLSYINLNQYANQNAQPVISGQKIYELSIAMPSMIEQKKIVNVLSALDEKIGKYKSKKEKLQGLKKGLMQKLLTGKIRVEL